MLVYHRGDDGDHKGCLTVPGGVAKSKIMFHRATHEQRCNSAVYRSIMLESALCMLHTKCNVRTQIEYTPGGHRIPAEVERSIKLVKTEEYNHQGWDLSTLRDLH
jgi:hypothetical protein